MLRVTVLRLFWRVLGGCTRVERRLTRLPALPLSSARSPLASAAQGNAVDSNAKGGREVVMARSDVQKVTTIDGLLRQSA
jgi:hypothetical protein